MSTERKLHPELLDSHVRPAGSRPPTLAPDAAAEHRDAAPPASLTNGEHSQVVVVPVPSSAAIPQAPTATRSPTPGQRSAVRVAPNIRDLITATPTLMPQEAQAAQERRGLNEVVHGVLILGLLISTALMIAGVGLDLFAQRELPTSVPDIGDAINRVLVLRPSGFLALGLLILIATPILRVIGSIGAFVYARDWRFASLTALVLIVLLVSLVLGRG
jgi:uncharacterized membrane protein